MLNHRDVVALAPDRKLFAGGRAEGVARREQHTRTAALQVLCELADAGGFAGAVDARDHHDVGALLRNREGLFQGCEQIGERVDKHGARVATAARLLPPLAQVHQQMLRSGHAAVGHQELSLQLLQRLLVELACEENIEAQLVARRGETGLEFVEPAFFLGLRHDDGGDVRGFRACSRLRCYDARRLRDGHGG